MSTTGVARQPARADERAGVTSAEWAWLAGILAVAFVLRLYKLDAGLWYDEIDTLVHFTRLPAADLLTTYPSLNHHVLFTLEAKGAIALLGESAPALRLPALLFGVASIAALWLLARQVLSAWEARFAALLLAVSYHHVWFSQNGRGYTGLLFLGLLATHLMLRAAKTPSWKTWSAYGVLSALAIYTHLTAAMLVAAQALVFVTVTLVRRHDAPPGSLLQGLYGFALAGLLALLLHAPLLTQMVGTFTRVATPATAEVAASIAEWKSPVWTVLEVFRSFGPLLGLALPVVLVLVLAGMAALRRVEPMLPALLVVHVGLTLAVLVAGSMRVWPRYFFVDIGFILLFLVHGVFVASDRAAAWARRAWQRRIDGRALAIGCTTLGVAASLALLPRNYLHPKQDFVGARDFVEAHREAGSVVLTLDLATMPYADYYAPQWKAFTSLQELQALREQGRPVWLVYTFPAVTERRFKTLMDAAASEFVLARRFPGTLGGGDVVVLRSRPRY
jgi:hypothetical protein